MGITWSLTTPKPWPRRSEFLVLFLRRFYDQKHGMAARPFIRPFATDEIVAGNARVVHGVFAQETEQDAVIVPGSLGLGTNQGRDVEQLPAIARLELVGSCRLGVILGLGFPRCPLAPALQQLEGMDRSRGWMVRTFSCVQF